MLGHPKRALWIARILIASRFVESGTRGRNEAIVFRQPLVLGISSIQWTCILYT